jgi:hypothetical protein
MGFRDEQSAFHIVNGVHAAPRKNFLIWETGFRIEK